MTAGTCGNVLRVSDFRPIVTKEITRFGRSVDRMDPVQQRISVVARLIVAAETAVSTEVAAVIHAAPIFLSVATGTTWHSIGVLVFGTGNPQ